MMPPAKGKFRSTSVFAGSVSIKKPRRYAIYAAQFVACVATLGAVVNAQCAACDETCEKEGTVCAQNPPLWQNRSGMGHPIILPNDADGELRQKSPEKSPAAEKRRRLSKPPDFNRDIYYKNKFEFALDAGWLPLNIPFPFDVFEGDPYELYPLRYTLVPVIASLRWHVDSIGSAWILRGNWDVTASASATAIPRGAETHYFSYDMGIRRNFVPRNSRVAPYMDVRCGLGIINAKGPLGVYYAQGQNFTFTMNMGAGARYNFSPRYAISAGLNWMHISNNNLSSPQYSNYGINVYGPMFGLDVRLRGHSR